MIIGIIITLSFRTLFVRLVKCFDINIYISIYFRSQSEERCDHVMLWTNQRIMHWLRSVDLAEYAPNLRGSGVNGSLMVNMFVFIYFVFLCHFYSNENLKFFVLSI